MSEGWENHEPAPIEFMHSRIMSLFHEWRKSQTEDSRIEIDGISLNDLIAKAKSETYLKYPKQKLREAILKSEM